MAGYTLFSTRNNFLSPVRPAGTTSRGSLGSWERRYMEGAAVTGGLAGVGELAGYAVGQPVLNQAFSVAQAGGRFAQPAISVAKRMALGPGEVASGVLGNIGHLAGLGVILGTTPSNWSGGLIGAIKQQGLFGAGAGLSQVQQWQGVTPSQYQRAVQDWRVPAASEGSGRKPPKPKPINVEPVRAIAQKAIQSQLRRTRTPASGGSRAF